jgi:hypothetical protein
MFSKKSVMIDTLADILKIEKDAVYRRMRQEVPFTFQEVVIITKNLNISLDNIVGIEGSKTIPFRLRLHNFISPQEDDYYMLNDYIKFLQSINQSENSEATSICNILPPNLFNELQYLSRFYFFIWNFYFNNDNLKPFHQISVSPEMNRFLTEHSIELKKFTKTCYVFDNRAFRLFVNDVIYFNSIRLLNDEDQLKMKEDLLSLLDYLEKIALTGLFKETGNSVNLYISDVDITTNYTYFETENIHFSMVKTFFLSSVTSFDEIMFGKMKRWIQSLIKTSTLITLTNEKQRVLYFEQQRKIINEL